MTLSRHRILICLLVGVCLGMAGCPKPSGAAGTTDSSPAVRTLAQEGSSGEQAHVPESRSLDCSGAGIEQESMELGCMHWDEEVLEALGADGVDEPSRARALDEVMTNPSGQFPINFLLAAYELAEQGRNEEAMAWFDLGMIRTYFEIPRIRNDGNLAIAMSVVVPDNMRIPMQCLAQKDPDAAERAWTAALEMDRTIGYDYNPYMTPGRPGYQQLLVLAEDNREKWAQIRQAHLEEIRRDGLDKSLPACVYQQQVEARMLERQREWEEQARLDEDETSSDSVYDNIGG